MPEEVKYSLDKEKGNVRNDERNNNISGNISGDQKTGSAVYYGVPEEDTLGNGIKVSVLTELGDPNQQVEIRNSIMNVLIHPQSQEFRETKTRIYHASKVQETESWLNSLDPENQIPDFLRGFQEEPEGISGLIPKKDVKAQIRIIDNNSLSNPNEPVVKFILQNARENRSEKFQIIDTFDDTKILFLPDEKPMVWQFSGTLLDTQDHNWADRFETEYDLRLRGSKTVENLARIYLNYSSKLLEGYILSFNTNRQAVNANNLGFAFNMFIVDITNSLFSGLGSGNIPEEKVLEVKQAIARSSGTVNDNIKDPAENNVNKFMSNLRMLLNESKSNNELEAYENQISLGVGAYGIDLGLIPEQVEALDELAIKHNINRKEAFDAYRLILLSLYQQVESVLWSR